MVEFPPEVLGLLMDIGVFFAIWASLIFGIWVIMVLVAWPHLFEEENSDTVKKQLEGELKDTLCQITKDSPDPQSRWEKLKELEAEYENESGRGGGSYAALFFTTLIITIVIYGFAVGGWFSMP